MPRRPADPNERWFVFETIPKLSEFASDIVRYTNARLRIDWCSLTAMVLGEVESCERLARERGGRADPWPQ